MGLPSPRLLGRAALPLGAAAALIFAIILVATSGALVFVNHVQLTRVAEREAREDFDTLAAAIRAEVATASRSASTLLGAMSVTVDSRDFSALQTRLFHLLQTIEGPFPAAFGLFVGFADGRHVGVQRLSGDLPPEVKQASGPGAAYAAMLVESGPDGAMQRWRILDEAGQVLGETVPAPTTFDPRARPWFDLALAANGMAATDPYQFANVAETGITLAQRSERLPGTVIGLDMTLADLDGFLARHREPPSLEPVIFAQDGTLVAHPDGSRFRGRLQDDPRAEAPLLDAMRRAFVSGKGGDAELSVGGTRYFARFESGGDLLKGYVIGAAVPYETMLGDAERIRTGLLMTSAIGIFCAVLLVLLAARALTSPLRLATDELRRVTGLQFGGGRGLEPSRILEVRDLWTAIATLEHALQNFVRYVPFGVVRGLVRRTFSPRLGGARQPVTVLFSDIAGFTQIAETLDPEELTARASAYFSALGEELLRSGATIDKYIGDSVMAFWNAPEPQEDHAALACLGALRAARRVDGLNAELAAQGMPPLLTRFGIHTGEAVVGNVGSVDRMNYTALGHTVNLASRLEGMNKVYGTTILVSGAVREAVGDRYRFRFVAKAVPAGASEAVEVYELLGNIDETDPEARNTGETASS